MGVGVGGWVLVGGWVCNKYQQIMQDNHLFHRPITHHPNTHHPTSTQISDATYGAAQRYVTRDRVEAMLEAEYLSCSLTLRKSRGNTTAFFAFADTVVAKAFNRANECHGWLGIKYQAQPKYVFCGWYF